MVRGVPAWMLVVTWLSSSLLSGVAASEARDLIDPGVSRVRSSNRQVLELLRRGRERSATFRRLIDRLDREAVLIYVESGRCRPADAQRLAGCLVFLGVNGGVRHMRAVIDVGGLERRVIATIGHELQHAIEIVEGGVTGPDSDGPGVEVRAGVYETEEAERVGRTILAELGQHDRSSMSRAKPSLIVLTVGCRYERPIRGL